MRNLSYAIAGAAALALCSAPAWAQGTPSSKAAYTFAGINVVTEISLGDDDFVLNVDPFTPCDPTVIVDGTCVLDLDALANSSHRILNTIIKMPKHKELAIDVSLECGNFLETKVKSKGGKSDTSSAEATVRVLVLVDDGTGFKVALPSGNPDRDLDLDGSADNALETGVVFCHRSQELEAKFQGIFQTGDPFVPEVLGDAIGNDDGICETGEACVESSIDEDIDNQDGICEGLEGNQIRVLDSSIVDEEGILYIAEVDTAEDELCATFVGTCLEIVNGRTILDLDCLTPEEVRLTTASMTATAFNFLYPNTAQSGVHEVAVVAFLDVGVTRETGTAIARAGIGLGSMQIETVRLINSLSADDLISQQCTIESPGDCGVDIP